ncbi:MAG: hypothetical protein K2L90_02700 [Muribaculaceae bacterium]|nr:hypothetical protein [Muribaculaceae bacterium]
MKKIISMIFAASMALCPISVSAAGSSASAAAAAPAGKSISESHFSWGASIGSSIDMSGNDMSSIDLSACFGYKGAGIQMAGVGAAIDMAVNNGSRMFPVYAIVRTNFRKKPSLCFMEAKAGCSFNSLYDHETQQGLYGSLGAGVNLATGKNFRSFVILSYTFNHIHPYGTEEKTASLSDLHLASISIGISF